jgi:pimeloyl-ACP methyl ester carboxylesterase
MTYITTAPGIRIYYETRGRGAATPLVLAHGFAGSSQQYIPYLLPLAERRPLILWDARGHGRSSIPKDPDAYSIPIFAADLAALLDTLAIEKAHIGGQSLGGMITAQFAVDYPDRCAGVVLADTSCGNGLDRGPAGDWERYVQMGIGTRAENAAKYGLEEAMRLEFEWRRQNDPRFRDSPYTLDDYLNRARHMTSEGYAGAARAIVTRPDLTARIPSLTAPALVMIGEWDGFYPCALRDHALLPNARLVVRRQCAHGFRWRTETWLSELQSFLHDADAGAPIPDKRQV